MLAVIIVSWNTCDLLNACLRSVSVAAAHAGLPYRVVVVDNASSDGSADMVRAQHPQVEVIESGRNLGFAGGNNLALRRLLADPAIDRFLLLNPDTVVARDALGLLCRELAMYPAVAVVGPQLWYGDGTRQSSRRRFPGVATAFFESTPLETRWPGNPWVRYYRMDDLADDVRQEVDWLVGAALLVRRSAVERAGLLDAGFQMYSEELEWQRRIRITGGTIVYLPAASITHYEGKSSEQAPARRYITFQQSKIRYVAMTHGVRAAQVLRAFLVAAYAGEWASEGLKRLASHKVRLRRRRMRVYGEVIRALMRG